jgi:DNA replication protein DnaC
VLALRTDQMLKTLKHARLDNSYEAELRRFLAVDSLILDDFAIDVLDATESRDLYEILLERYRTGSIVVTSNPGRDEWLATFGDPLRAQSAIDRFTSNAYDLVVDGESYRPRLKPTVPKARATTTDRIVIIAAIDHRAVARSASRSRVLKPLACSSCAHAPP